MQHYRDVVQDRSGNVIGGAIVTVIDHSSGQSAPLYSDANGSVPLTSVITDTNGTFSFYVASGRYDITISKNGIVLSSVSDVFITVTADYPTAMSEADATAGISTLPQTISASVLQTQKPTAMDSATAQAGTSTTPQTVSASVLDGAVQYGAFTPSGTGAVSRTLQSKLRDVVSVKDFGAVGDGVTDDTAAIQAALNSSHNVYIPLGIYLFTSLTINNRNTKLYGESAKVSILKHTGSGVAITCNDTTSTSLDGRGVYIEDGWFIFEDFELMVYGTIGFEIGKTRSSFSQWTRVYIRHIRDIEGGDPNNQYFSGSSAISCNNNPWISSYSTYNESLNSVFIRGFENAIKLNDTVNFWTINNSYFIENKNCLNINSSTGIKLNNSYIESGIVSAKGIVFGVGGGNNIAINNTAFELTNVGATQYAYDFSAAGTWSQITAVGIKYLIQGDGNAVNNRRYVGTPPVDFVEINRSYTNATYGDIPMLWAPSISASKPFQMPNFSRFGGANGLGTGTIYLSRNDTDAADVKICSDNAYGITFQAGNTGSLADFVFRNTNTIFLSFKGYTTPGLTPGQDNAYAFGSASNRWTTIYATTGTINTSDERQKTDLLEISEKEKLCALELKQNLKKFKFKESIETKGDSARVHFGVGAQKVKSIFEKYNLIAEEYALFCYDEWDDQIVDEQIIAKAGNRFGIRYDELFAFILAAI